ncbi:restriction endonuclease subunit S [Alkalibacillus salilacus]|uniref:Restriction endonuclease S subunit n=1 Tax=Alkalibacillus salilacus TaxID=284582 RepID=A0ABT9VIF8_9BACI|nr:restriction endonuclease subunit S [Alkalibacillus salilacus]MDQ0160743.1 restriction endonuclease S subunit [Alkalibacillus salilacus]
MKLGDIAQIKMGLVLSRKKARMDFDIKKKYPLVSLGNLDEEGIFNAKQFETFGSQSILDERYLTKKGDILFRLTYPYTALYIDNQHEGLLIPSSFGIIQVVNPNFMSEYVAWYLNSNVIKHELERAQSGSMVASTNKNILQGLEIKELPLVRQETITEVLELYQQEKQLYEQLVIEKGKYIEAITNKLLLNEEE